MGININDLSPLGASLLADKESFLDNISDLSTEELKISGGGGYYGGGSSSSGGGRKRRKRRKKYYYYGGGSSS